VDNPTRSTNKPGNTSQGTPPPHTPPRSTASTAPNTVITDFLSRTAADDKMPSDQAMDFRHSGWAPYRARVEQALRETEGITPRRLAAFSVCGADAWIESRRKLVHCPRTNFDAATTGTATHFGNEYRIKSTKCHDRFCVPCSQERSFRVRQALLKHMQPLDNLKLITLTLKASTDGLSAILDRITRCFRLLRNRPIWKKNIEGGVSIIETKLGKNSGAWHCHFHVVCRGKFTSQAKLADEWQRITTDSRIVDIRPVGARSGAVTYITKYITKAADHEIVMSPKHLSEAIVAFTGRRMVSTFGTWRGLELMEKPHEEQFITEDGIHLDRDAWCPVGPLGTLLAAAAAGDAAAIIIFAKLRQKPARPPPNV
jgi:hypothetical protein